MFLHKNIWVSLNKVLVKYYFCTLRLLEDARLLFNIIIVQLIIKNLCHNDVESMFLYWLCCMSFDERAFREAQHKIILT